MSLGVTTRVRTYAVIACAVVALAIPRRAHAQTTLVLDAPDSESVDTFIRGGSYAGHNYNGSILVTRASDTSDNVRRTLLKFDTDTRIPSGTAIASAKLTLTVHGGYTATRLLSAYRVASSFDEATATWTNRSSSSPWNTAGGDLASRYAQANVYGPGSKVTFDVTKLVQDTVDGAFGSRYTRIAIVDAGASSYDSYREYYSSEASDASVRPTLTVTYGGSSSTSSSSSGSTSTSTPLPSGWSSADVGAVGTSGSASGSFTVNGAGADVWGYADAFRFAYTKLSGDGTVTAEVSSEEAVADWTKAGVMMRETLGAGSRHAFAMVTPGKGARFQRRLSTGGASSDTSGGTGKAPYWVRLKRSGNTFTAYKSADGSNWTTIGSDTISMASTIYVGLAVSSHDTAALAAGLFASTSVKTAATSVSATSTSTSGMTTLRVLQWNTHHGGTGTDGVYDPARLASYAASYKPDVISFNEVGDQSQADALLYWIRNKTGNSGWTSHWDGRGNMVLSRLSKTAADDCLVNASVGRKSAHMAILVNGLTVNVWSSHLALDSSSTRTSEVNALWSCEKSWPEARIAMGDYNMQPYSTEYYASAANHVDGWLKAKSLGTAYNYSGNCDGCTRNSRIDYVWLSKGATTLSVKSAQIYDTRDANGVMPSDHKPLLLTFSVK